MTDLTQENSTKELDKKAYFKAYRTANKEKMAAQTKAWKEANKERTKEYNKAYREANREKMTVQTKAWKEANKERVVEKRKAYNESNKEKIAEYAKARYDKERVKEYNKAYRAANKECIRTRDKERTKHRLKTDLLYKTRTVLRRNCTDAFIRISKNKPANTEKLLGCTWLEAKEYFERLFQPGMSWDNHGEWHIDHIRPVSSFTEVDMHLMNHISNLQPLWAEDNLQKGDKYYLG